MSDGYLDTWRHFVNEGNAINEQDYGRGDLIKWQRYADEIERTMLQFKMKKQKLTDAVRQASRDEAMLAHVFDPSKTTPRAIADSLTDMQRSAKQLQDQLNEWTRFMQRSMM